MYPHKNVCNLLVIINYKSVHVLGGPYTGTTPISGIKQSEVHSGLPRGRECGKSSGILKCFF